MAKQSASEQRGSLVPYSPEWIADLASRIELREEVRNQTDRGAAIVAAAIVDESLTALIKSRLHVVRTKGDSKGKPKIDTAWLFDHGGAFGSFYVKINVAFALRFISEEMCLDLLAIRDIRNDFAHSTQVENSARRRQAVTFRTQKIADKCKSLRYPKTCPPSKATALGNELYEEGFPILEIVERMREVADQPDVQPSDPRERFIYTCEGIERHLEDAIREGDSYRPSTVIYRPGNVLSRPPAAD